MKNIILTIAFLLPIFLNGQDKNYPYSIMDWINDNVNNYEVIPPAAIDVNLCGLNNPVFGQNSSDMNGVFNDLMCAQCNQPQINADNFFFADDQTIGSICWVGYYFGAATDCTPASTPTFTITYYADNAGLPGAILATFSLVPTAIPTGNIIGGANQTVFTAEHAPVDFLAGPEYWVAIYTTIPDAAAPCDYAWDVSNEGDGFSSVAEMFPTGWVASGTDYTFFLGSTALIPTLSQWGIMVLALLLIIIGVVGVKVPYTRLKSI